nr:ORF13 [Acipenserid herpesvirus 1]
MNTYINSCWDLLMGPMCAQTISLHKTVKSLLYQLTDRHYVFGDTQINLDTPTGHWMFNVCPPTSYGAIEGIDFHVRLAAGVMELHVGQKEKQLLSLYPIERHNVVNLWYALSHFYLADDQKLKSLIKAPYVSGSLNKLKLGRYHKHDGRYYLIQQFYHMAKLDPRVESLVDLMLQYIHHPKDITSKSEPVLIFNTLMLQAEHMVVVDTETGAMFCDVAYITDGQGNMCSVSFKTTSNGIELWYKPLFSSEKTLLDYLKLNIQKCIDKNVVCDPAAVYKQPISNKCLEGVFVVGVNTDTLNQQIINYRRALKTEAQIKRHLPLSVQEKRKGVKDDHSDRLLKRYKDNDIEMC